MTCQSTFRHDNNNCNYCNQCDQMVWLIYNIRPFTSMKNSPIMSQICQRMLSILPNTCKLLPKWRIFAKSSHTDCNAKSVCTVRYQSYSYSGTVQCSSGPSMGNLWRELMGLYRHGTLRHGGIDNFSNGPTAAYFCLFWENCPSSIRRRDSNPWPLNNELSPITIRPGRTLLLQSSISTSFELARRNKVKIIMASLKSIWKHYF